MLQAGSEQFNTKAKKGLEFLQEHGFLSKPLDPEEVANHLRENIRLDKKAIGDYIGDRKNTKVLEAFAEYALNNPITMYSLFSRCIASYKIIFNNGAAMKEAHAATL